MKIRFAFSDLSNLEPGYNCIFVVLDNNVSLYEYSCRVQFSIKSSFIDFFLENTCKICSFNEFKILYYGNNFNTLDGVN